MAHIDETTPRSAESLLFDRLGALPDAKRIMNAAGIGRTHLYAELKARRFPAPSYRHGARMVRWRFEDVLPWFEDPAGWIAKHAPAEAAEAA